MLKVGPKVVSKEKIGTTWDEYGNSNIVQILISHQGNIIKSIQFVYADPDDHKDNKCLRQSQTYGQIDDTNFNMVTLRYPSEYLTWVSGAYILPKTINNNVTGGLSSITFGTNKGEYGPFGTGTTNTFTYDFGHRSSFLGFHGTVYKESRVFAIGIYIKPIESLDELPEDEEATAIQPRSEKSIVSSIYI